MNYNFLFTVVNGTTRAAPSTKDMHVSKGRIVHAALYFPAAANDVVNVVIEHHGSQILPANPDGYYYGDLTILEFPDCVVIGEAPYILKAIGWNSSGGDVVVAINLTVVPFPTLDKIYPPAA